MGTCRAVPEAPRKKESAPGLVSERASVNEDGRSIPQPEWERMCKWLWAPFALMAVLYAIWEVVACPW